jgi:hypothetical protein
MMTIANRRVGSIGPRAFYLNPEANVGNGATPDSISEPDGELSSTTIPDSITGTTTTTGATPDPKTESTTTTH